MTSRKDSADDPLLSGAALTDDDYPRRHGNAASPADETIGARRAPVGPDPSDPRRRRGNGTDR